MVKYARVIGFFVVSIFFSFLSACSSHHAAPAQKEVVSAVPVPSTWECELDAQRICREARKADFKMKAGTAGANGQEQNAGVRTQRFDIDHQIPNGSKVKVHCEINTAHHKVLYAHAVPGTVLTDLDVETLKSSGYCVR